jgi:hypothetical protein
VVSGWVMLLKDCIIKANALCHMALVLVLVSPVMHCMGDTDMILENGV